MAIAARYKGYRYPIEVIGHAVWLYHRFTLSLRDVEELMLARGVVVTYETIRSWCAKFGPDYAAQLRRWRPRPGDKWHLDEVFVKINGATHYLWRAVDQHGDVLDILVQSRRNAVAAKRFFRKLLKGLRYVPRVMVTDKLASYQVAHREVLPSVGDALSSTAVHNSRNSSKRSQATCSWARKALPHNVVRGAIRMATRCGSSAGNASASFRARSQLSCAAACRGWSPTLRRACANRRRRAHHRRPPNVRR